MNKITVIVNGEAKAANKGDSVDDLLRALGLGGVRVALEYNGEFLEQSRAGETPLSQGDRLEIVRFVGGG